MTDRSAINAALFGDDNDSDEAPIAPPAAPSADVGAGADTESKDSNADFDVSSSDNDSDAGGDDGEAGVNGDPVLRGAVSGKKAGAMAEIFGDDSDESDDDKTGSGGRNGSGGVGASSGVDGETTRPVSVESVSKHRLAPGAKARVLKLPSFLHVDGHLFTPEAFDEIDGRDPVRQRMRLENTIRNRRVQLATGETRVETNTRLFRFEDGSLVLQVGREQFDVEERPVEQVNSFVMSVGKKKPKGHERGGGGGRTLVGECAAERKWVLKPRVGGGETHHRLTASLAAHQKKKQVQMINLLEDPMIERERRIKAEDERTRAQTRRDAKKRTRIEQSLTSDSLTRDQLESDDDSGPEESVSRIKAEFNRAKKGKGKSQSTHYKSKDTVSDDDEDEDDDDDDDDMDGFVKGSDESESGESDHSDEDQSSHKRKKPTKGPAKSKKQKYD